MKRTAGICILLLWASSATAMPGEDDPAPLPPGTVHLELSAPDSAGAQGSKESAIRLGSPAAQGAWIQAVETFLSSRQDGSIDPSLTGGARSHLQLAKEPDEAILFGPKGTTLVAFDFRDDGIESLGPDRFRVPVYLLFADSEGLVVESRDEALTFTGEAGVYACTALDPINTISWREEGLRGKAQQIGAEGDLDKLQHHLRDWARKQPDLTGYSMADVIKRVDGLAVRCIQFHAKPGRRGYDVTSSTVILQRSGDSIRIESN